MFWLLSFSWINFFFVWYGSHIDQQYTHLHSWEHISTYDGPFHQSTASCLSPLPIVSLFFVPSYPPLRSRHLVWSNAHQRSPLSNNIYLFGFITTIFQHATTCFVTRPPFFGPRLLALADDLPFRPILIRRKPILSPNDNLYIELSIHFYATVITHKLLTAIPTTYHFFNTPPVV